MGRDDVAKIFEDPTARMPSSASKLQRCFFEAPSTWIMCDPVLRMRLEKSFTSDLLAGALVSHAGLCLT